MARPDAYRAPRRLYLSRDKSRVVEEGDPEAGFLLAGTGVVVPEADVERYQLRELPSDTEGEAPEAKMVKGPPENKAQAPPSVPRSEASEVEEKEAPPAGRRATKKDSA